MILNDRKIDDLATQEQMVDPYLAENLQPASIDLRLGDQFRTFEHFASASVDLASPSTHQNITNLRNIGDREEDDAPFMVLHPGEFVLGATKEFVKIPDNIVARVEGKSSLGRLGLLVHATAGFIDPGFHGSITLEMSNLLRVPIILRPGILICQISFMYMCDSADVPYRGRYQHSTGVDASRYGEDVKFVANNERRY